MLSQKVKISHPPTFFQNQKKKKKKYWLSEFKNATYFL